MSEWLRAAVMSAGGLVEAASRYKDDLAYWVEGRREIAHLEAENALDLRLTKAVIRERRVQLRADPRVELRAAGSDWVTLVVTPQDKQFVRDMVALAVRANQI